jgi:hypothetical protein
VQIDDDGRTIKRGLVPINDVLRHVRFRQDATLSVEPAERPSSDLEPETGLGMTGCGSA